MDYFFNENSVCFNEIFLQCQIFGLWKIVFQIHYVWFRNIMRKRNHFHFLQSILSWEKRKEIFHYKNKNKKIFFHYISFRISFINKKIIHIYYFIQNFHYIMNISIRNINYYNDKIRQIPRYPEIQSLLCCWLRTTVLTVQLWRLQTFYAIVRHC